MSPEGQEPTVRRHVSYHGRVQGVFFRATTRDLARGYRVAGYVRNVPDGTVELEAEGPASEVERFLAAVASKFRHNITSADVNDIPPVGSETGFQIRY